MDIQRCWLSIETDTLAIHTFTARYPAMAASLSRHTLPVGGRSRVAPKKSYAHQAVAASTTHARVAGPSADDGQVFHCRHATALGHGGS